MTVEKKKTKSPKNQKSTNSKKNLDQKNKLDSKTQLQVLLFSLLTFGVFYILLNIKIKENKKDLQVNSVEQQTLITTEEIPFEILQLTQLLGGIENIVNIESTLNTLRVEVIDAIKVNTDGIKKLGAKGILKTNNKFSIIFGDYASHLKNQMTNNFVKKITPNLFQVSDRLIDIPSFYHFVNDMHCEKSKVVDLLKIPQFI